MITLDHLAVTGATLAAAAERVEATLDCAMEAGGVHATMGTHNRLLSLGPGQYLEAIAIDPGAAAPVHPRWFDLDGRAGPPRLTNWVVRCPDLAAALAEAPEGMGVPVDFTRGRFAWTMAVPPSGRLPFDGAAPAVMSWAGASHPSDALPDRGLRLQRLEVAHPEAAGLRRAFPALERLAQVTIEAGALALRAQIATPSGLRMLE